MTTSGGRRLQAIAALLLIGTYVGLSHYSNSAPDAHTLGALLALGPLVSAAVIALWRYARPWVAAAAAAGLIVALMQIWSWFKSEYPWFYVMQDFSLYSMLALTFGRSLLPGHVPLCTQFADKVHGPLLEVEVAYTRRVTLAWTGFFVADAITTLALFLAAPLRVWSFFSYILSPLLVVGLFIGEYFLRRVALPQRPRGGILAGVFVYFDESH